MATALPKKKIRWGEQIVYVVLFIAAAISVLTTVGIVLSLVLPALDFFREVSPVDFFTGTTWAPLFLDAQFGVLPLVVGTLMISFWSALVAFPLGIGVAIYLSEYAAPRATAFLKPILEILAAIPTVVLGYFALTFVTPFLRDQLERSGGDLQRAVGEPRARDHAHSHRCDPLGGRDGGRAARPARRRLCARLRQAAGVDAHRRAGGRSPGSSLRSCSRSRARSERR